MNKNTGKLIVTISMIVASLILLILGHYAAGIGAGVIAGILAITYLDS